MAGVSLGKMLDHAVHSLHQKPDAFFELFIASGMAGAFEQMDILTIAGRSGIELSYEVLRICGISFDRVTPRHTTGRSREFSAGSALASSSVFTPRYFSKKYSPCFSACSSVR